MLFKTSGALGVYADAWTKVAFLRPDVVTFLEVYNVLALPETWQMISGFLGCVRAVTADYNLGNCDLIAPSARHILDSSITCLSSTVIQLQLFGVSCCGCLCG